MRRNVIWSFQDSRPELLLLAGALPRGLTFLGQTGVLSGGAAGLVGLPLPAEPPPSLLSRGRSLPALHPRVILAPVGTSHFPWSPGTVRRPLRSPRDRSVLEQPADTEPLAPRPRFFGFC